MRYKVGDYVRIDLGMRMDTSIPESRYFYVQVYKHRYTYIITGVAGWKPCGWSDWTLDGMLGNGANEGFKKVSKKDVPFKYT